MTMPHSIAQVDVAGKTILVRADLNVPMQGGAVGDQTRLARFAPTVADLTKRGASVVIMSHLGRPRHEPNPVYTLAPVATALEAELGRPVGFSPECVGTGAEAMTRDLKPGMIMLLENLRFHAGEEANEDSFAMMLSVHGDLYVNDAFSCAHRAHASTHAIARHMPSFAGPSLLSEIQALSRALDHPEYPSIAVVGGAKVSSKIAVLRHVVGRVDRLVIGGAMANTFLAALGYSLGRSLYEPNAVAMARHVMDEARRLGCALILPEDLVVARSFAANAPHEVVPANAVPDDAMALDLGIRSIQRITDALAASRTLLWNGPLGAFEMEPFGTATFVTAQKAAELTRQGRLVSVAGGGDTAAAMVAAGVQHSLTHLSTAGGAFLEWIEGRSLPGIEALTQHTSILEHS